MDLSQKSIDTISERLSKLDESIQEVDIIPLKLYEESQKMPDFRNLAIHVYLKIDAEKVYNDLPISLRHFRE